MSRIILPMLGIETWHHRYSVRDDGFVDDMSEHLGLIFREFGLLRPVPTENDSAGYTFIDPDFTRIIIFYEHHSPLRDIVTQAHEETHALHIIGQERILEQRLQGAGYGMRLRTSGTFWSCAEKYKELLARIGGLYGLHRQGYDISSLDKLTLPKHYWKALALLKETKKRK